MLTPEERERDRATGRWHLQVMRRLDDRPRSRIERLADATRARAARAGAASARAVGHAVDRLTPVRGTLARAAAVTLVALVAAPWARSVPVRRPPVRVADHWYGRAAETLDGSASEDEKLAFVDALRPDPSETATRILVRGIDDPSILVSMASLRALSGRPCAAVGDALARGLGDAAWQRRAWAAKVLGENGCRAASPRLAERLRIERDARVERHLTLALYTLGARASR